MAIKSSDALTRFQKVVQTPNVDRKTIEAEYNSLLEQTVPAERDQFKAAVANLFGSTNAANPLGLVQPGSTTGVQLGQTTTPDTTSQQPPPAITAKPVALTQQNYSTQDFLQLSRQQLQIVQGILSDIAANRVSQQHDIDTVSHDRDAALTDLSRAVLPDLTPKSLAAASRITGLPPAQIADFAAEDAALKQQFTDANKAADTSLASLATLVHVPTEGALAAGQKDSDEMHRKLSDVQAKLAGYAGIEGLVERHYGTPQDRRWWITSASYRQDKNTDKMLQTKFGKHSFDEVLAEYRALQQQQGTLQQQLVPLDSALGAVKQTRDVATALRTRIQNLPADALARARENVGRIFRTTAKEDLAKRITDPVMVQFYKTYSALSAKVDYMTDIAKQLATQEQQYKAEALRLQTEAVGWAQTRINKGQSGTLTQKQAMWRLGHYDWDNRARSYNRCWEINRRIYGYNSYYRSPSLLQSWLWWYVFTGGYYDSWYRPYDVNIWVNTYHPGGYHYDPPSSTDTEAARRAAEEARRHSGDGFETHSGDGFPSTGDGFPPSTGDGFPGRTNS